MSVEICPVCAQTQFVSRSVIWQDLQQEWELSKPQLEYINRQQGFQCVSCQNNMRAIALADAILKTYNLNCCLNKATGAGPLATLRIAEINPAGGLTATLQEVPGHRLLCYPEYDLCDLAITSSEYDLVIHSDTLEHIPDPLAGLSECHRILKPGGHCIFTVPFLMERLTRSRSGMPDSFHGAPGTSEQDLLVHTEFGADIWQYPIKAGFSTCTVHSLEYPAGLAIVATKT